MVAQAPSFLPCPPAPGGPGGGFGSFTIPCRLRPAETGSGDAVNREDSKARFTKVVMPHLDDAFGLARWLTGNRADAEDVVQEACLRALRGIAGFAGGSARAWVLTIVRHAAYTWLGKNRPAALVVTDDLEAVERAAFSRGGGGGTEA